MRIDVSGDGEGYKVHVCKAVLAWFIVHLVIIDA